MGSTPSSRVIMHIDLDAFYPSVEIRRTPSLKGKPVIVGAPPKGGHGRGVVTSCSYEARKYGVRSGQPISQAWKLCPEPIGIYLPPDFRLYGEVSDRVMGSLRKYADKFEQTSIDEAFLDVTEKCPAFQGVENLAGSIKEELRSNEGLTCSIGVAPNKSIAKIASDYKKPDGLIVVTPERVREFLDPLPVDKISGVGKKTTEILTNMGIPTIGQLAKIPGKKLTEIFGKGGVWLWAIATGIEEAPVEERGLRKSLSLEQTFEHDVRNREVVREAIESLCDEVHERLILEGLLYRTVGIKVRFEGFKTFTREKTHTGYVDDKGLIHHYAILLFKEFEKDKRKIRLVGVRLSHLRRGGPHQESILEWAK